MFFSPTLALFCHTYVHHVEEIHVLGAVVMWPGNCGHMCVSWELWAYVCVLVTVGICVCLGGVDVWLRNCGHMCVSWELWACVCVLGAVDIWPRNCVHMCVSWELWAFVCVPGAVDMWLRNSGHMCVSWELWTHVLRDRKQCELWKHNFHVYDVIDSYLSEDQEQILSFTK